MSESPSANRFYNGSILDRNTEKAESTAVSLSLRRLAPVAQPLGSAPLLIPAFPAFASTGAVCSFSKLRALGALLTAFKMSNSFAFSRFRSLAQKIPGVGGTAVSRARRFAAAKTAQRPVLSWAFNKKITFSTGAIGDRTYS
jgi:hypothetical protein